MDIIADSGVAANIRDRITQKLQSGTKWEDAMDDLGVYVNDLIEAKNDTENKLKQKLDSESIGLGAYERLSAKLKATPESDLTAEIEKAEEDNKLVGKDFDKFLGVAKSTLIHYRTKQTTSSDTSAESTNLDPTILRLEGSQVTVAQYLDKLADSTSANLRDAKLVLAYKARHEGNDELFHEYGLSLARGLDSLAENSRKSVDKELPMPNARINDTDYLILLANLAESLFESGERLYKLDLVVPTDDEGKNEQNEATIKQMHQFYKQADEVIGAFKNYKDVVEKEGRTLDLGHDMDVLEKRMSDIKSTIADQTKTLEDYRVQTAFIQESEEKGRALKQEIDKELAKGPMTDLDTLKELVDKYHWIIEDTKVGPKTLPAYHKKIDGGNAMKAKWGAIETYVNKVASTPAANSKDRIDACKGLINAGITNFIPAYVELARAYWDKAVDLAEEAKNPDPKIAKEKNDESYKYAGAAKNNYRKALAQAGLTDSGETICNVALKAARVGEDLQGIVGTENLHIDALYELACCEFRGGNDIIATHDLLLASELLKQHNPLTSPFGTYKCNQGDVLNKLREIKAEELYR